MAAVRCSVDGCSRRLQPALKVDPRDSDTWIYPECDVCGGYVCEEHCSEVEGQVVCDRCRREAEAPPLLGLGLLPPADCAVRLGHATEGDGRTLEIVAMTTAGERCVAELRAVTSAP